MSSIIPHENIELDSDENNIQSIIQNSLEEKWIKTNKTLIIKNLTDGLSNNLFSARTSETHGVIVKIYGTNSDLIVDRQAEIKYMIYLSTFHISPSILLTFNNGFIYQYVPGEPMENGNENQS